MGQRTITPLLLVARQMPVYRNIWKCIQRFCLFLLSAGSGAGFSHASTGRDHSAARAPTHRTCGCHRYFALTFFKFNYLYCAIFLSLSPPLCLGNGPSGICLSYLLSGYKPYLDNTTVHPNPILYRKLQDTKHLPITEQVTRRQTLHIFISSFKLRQDLVFFFLQDLEYLSEGLEGRSKNPVAVLFDTLLHPNADFGYEFPPVLQWKRDKQQHIPHLVLGRATPGGAWHVSSPKGSPALLRSFSMTDLFSGKFHHLFPPAVLSSGYGRLHADHQPWYLDGASRGELQGRDDRKTQVLKVNHRDGRPSHLHLLTLHSLSSDQGCHQ